MGKNIGQTMDVYKMIKTKIIAILFIIILAVSGSNIVISKTLEVQDGNIEKLKLKSENLNSYILGEFIIKFKDNTNLNYKKSPNDIITTGIDSVDKLNKEFNVYDINSLFDGGISQEFSNMYKVRLPKELDISSIVKLYKTNPYVEYAEPNYIYQSCFEPNDSLFNRQWALNQSNDHDIDAVEAWDIETGSSEITIAIIDSGVDYNHPDIASKIWINEDEVEDGKDTDKNGYVDDILGWDYVNKDNDPKDDNGHGTHCAGIASAASNNEIGVAGVSWNCKIMPLKVLNESGSGSMLEVAKAIFYAVDNGARVISMSLGNKLYSMLIDQVIEYAKNKNVVVIAAAGNDDQDGEFYPAKYKYVIGVAATDSLDMKADFSNYGDWIDISAPGVNILSLRANGTDMYGDGAHIVDRYYYLASGTSMACPHVAGAAGLLLSYDNSLNYNQIKDRIYYSADRLNPSYKIGRGRLNINEMLLRGPGPATAIINKPIHLSEVKGETDIIGTATGDGFKYYTLESAKGKKPSEGDWALLKNSTSTIDNDTIITIDTTTLDEGIYSYRLILYCDSGIYKDTIWLVVNNYKNTVYVDDDERPGIEFNSIQEGIDQCGTGDNVYVYNGTYQERIDISKSISLIGENNKNTTIKSFNYSTCISLKADNVNISGFKINDSKLNFGILLEKSNYCSIKYNIIDGNTVGIKLIQSSYNIITENNITFNEIGVRITLQSNHNEISKNNFINFHLGPFRFMYEHATYCYSYFNKWKNNYWDDWPGVNIIVLRVLPRRIPFRIWDLSGIMKIPRIRSDFDFIPARTIYDIPVTDPDFNPGGES